MLMDHAGDGALVSLTAAAKRYTWRAPWVLRDLDLAVARGRLVEVRGANGSGVRRLPSPVGEARAGALARRLGGMGCWASL